MKISLEDAVAIRAAFNNWENSATSDEPHWTYEESYKSLKKRITDFIKEKSE